MSFQGKNFLKCASLIKNDDLVTALSEAKSFTDWHKQNVSKCLVELQLLCYNFSSGKSVPRSMPEDVFNLANYFCSTIEESNYDCDTSKFITCVYFISKFLIEKELINSARKLCEYIIKLISKKGIVVSSSDKKFLRYVNKLFSFTLFDMDIPSCLEKEENDDIFGDSVSGVMCSFIDLWKFNLNFIKIDNEIKISDHINILGNLLKKFNSLNINVVQYIHNDCLSYLLTFLNDYMAGDIVFSDRNVAFISTLELVYLSVSGLIGHNSFCEVSCILNTVKNLGKLFCGDNEVKVCLFFENFLYFLYFFLISPSRRDSIYENKNITKVLQDSHVLFKELMEMKDYDLFKKVYLIVLTVFQKIKFWPENNYDKDVYFHNQSFNSLLDFLFSVCDKKFIQRIGDNPNSLVQLSVQNGITLMINGLTLIFNLLIVSLKNEKLKLIPDDYYHFSERLRQQSTSLVDLLLKLQSEQLESYLLLVLRSCMTLCNVYFSLESYGCCASLVKQLCVYIISLPSETVIKIKKKCHLSKVLIYYYSCCNELGKPLDGLLAIIAWYLSSSLNTYNEELIKYWTSIKTSRKCSTDIMGLTIFDVATKYSETLVVEWGINQSLIDTADWSPFLLLEIRAYHFKRSLQDEPLKNAFQSLMSIKPAVNTILIAEALIFTIDVVTKDINGFNNMDNNLTAMFDSVSKKLISKKNKTYKESCVLGNLLLCKVRCDIYSRRKNIESALINCTVKNVPLKLDPETGLVESTDPFETVVVGSAILFSKQEHLIQQLDDAVYFIKTALIQKYECASEVHDIDEQFKQTHEKRDNNELSPDFVLLCLNNINCAAQLYKLYCEDKLAADTWHLLYYLCQLISKHSDIALEALANLLDLSASPEFRNELLKKAATLGYKSVLTYEPSKFLDLSLSTDQEKRFFIHLANQCLSSSNLVECAFILNALSGNSSFSENLTNVYYFRTICKFLALPNSKSLWQGKPPNIFKALHETRRILHYIVVHRMWRGYGEHLIINELFLEVLSVSSHCCNSMSSPVEAYGHLNEALTVAQKLALPLWTCKLLIALSWTDIFILKLTDCELKVCNIEAILGLKIKKVEKLASPVLNTFLDEINIHSAVSYNKNDVTNVPNRESVLNSVKNTFYETDSISSVLKNPSSACIFVDIIILRAVLLSVKEDYIQATSWFDYGLGIINQLMSCYFQNISKTNMLLVRKSVLLFNYARLLNKKNNDAALEFYEKAFEYCNADSSLILMHPFQTNFCNSLYFIQKLRVYESYTERSPQDDLNTRLSSLTLSSSNDISVTPTNKTEIPVFVTPLLKSSIKKKNVDLSPGDIPNTFSLLRRKLKFFSDSNDDDDDNNCENNDPSYLSDCSTVPAQLKSKLNINKQSRLGSGSTNSTCTPFKLFNDNDCDRNENSSDSGDRVHNNRCIRNADKAKTSNFGDDKSNKKKLTSKNVVHSQRKKRTALPSDVCKLPQTPKLGVKKRL